MTEVVFCADRRPLSKGDFAMVSRAWTAGLLALALLLPAARAAAPEPSGSEKIDKLIGQLGSNDFAEREKASAELEKIGADALPALEKAAKAEDDAEVS